VNRRTVRSRNAATDRPQVSWAVRSATSEMIVASTTRHATTWTSVRRALGAYTKAPATTAPVIRHQCAPSVDSETTNPILEIQHDEDGDGPASKRSRFAIYDVAPRRPRSRRTRRPTAA
jgi:hypothetical protein